MVTFSFLQSFDCKQQSLHIEKECKQVLDEYGGLVKCYACDRSCINYGACVIPLLRMSLDICVQMSSKSNVNKCNRQ